MNLISVVGYCEGREARDETGEHGRGLVVTTMLINGKRKRKINNVLKRVDLIQENNYVHLHRLTH